MGAQHYAHEKRPGVKVHKAKYQVVDTMSAQFGAQRSSAKSTALRMEEHEINGN